MRHRLRNVVSAIFCLLLGLAVAWKGVSLGLKLGSEMGPGFFPCLAGGILALLSLILFLQSMKGKHPGTREPFWMHPRSWLRVFLTLLPLGIYPFVIDRLGFFLSSLFLLIFLFGVIARLRWTAVWLGGLITTLGFYLVFNLWLKANLPAGPLGF